MSEVSSQAPRAPLNDAEMAELERRLDALAPARDPLDLSMLDGYLTGVLLQPKPLPEAQWLPLAFDVEGRPLPESVDAEPLRALVRRRHAELNRAIHHRQWFDPWVFELDEDAEPLETVMPWVAGFATAMEHFPALMDMESPELLEPLAALYRAFDPEDLEDAEDLLEMIEELEPPADLPEAVEALVSSSLLLADVSRPQSTQNARQSGARTPAHRPGGAPRGGRGGGRPGGGSRGGPRR